MIIFFFGDPDEETVRLCRNGDDVYVMEYGGERVVGSNGRKAVNRKESLRFVKVAVSGLRTISYETEQLRTQLTFFPFTLFERRMLWRVSSPMIDV